MPNNNEIKHRLKDYLKSSKSRHAMLLYGEWGSGKSHFVRNDLKAYLEGLDEPVTVIYTTAAGFTTPDDLLERIATAYINELASIEESPDDSKRKKLLNEARKSGLGFLKKLAAEIGDASGALPSLSDSAFLSLMLPKKALVIIDDMERRAFALSHNNDPDADHEEFDDALFSALCRLVEEHGHKVLLIANSRDAIPADIMEKLVWDRIEFKPNSDELVDSILKGSIEQFPKRLNVREQIVSAQGLTGKYNARRLIRIQPLLELMAQCNFFKNDEIDIAIQKDTLKDVVYVALRVSDSEKEESKSDANWLEAEEFEQYQSKLNTLKCFKMFFAEGIKPSIDELNNNLIQFAKKYHPQSQKEKIALAALSSIRSRAFEDEDGEEFFRVIVDALNSEEMDISNIPSILHAVDFLKHVGIASFSDFENVLQLSEQLLMRNTSFSRNAINEDMIGWQIYSDDKNDHLDAIDNLRDAVLLQYKKEAYSRLMENVQQPNESTGLIIAQNADAWFGSDPDGLISISPSELKEHIRLGSCASITALLNAIAQLYRWGSCQHTNEKEKIDLWCAELSLNLEGVKTESKMRDYKIGKLREYLQSNKDITE